jgi:hypothetical protein
VQRAGHRTGNGAAKPAEQSGPDAVELAALEYAKELPAMLRRAMKRAARGKPSPLLRSAPRLIREAMQLLDMKEERHARKPQEHPQLGVLSDYELQLCTNLLELHRAQRTAAEPPAAAPAPEPLEREEPAPEPAAPAPQPLYNGPDRRVRHIPSTVFLGTQERRRRQQRATSSLIAGQRVVYIGEPPDPAA